MSRIQLLLAILSIAICLGAAAANAQPVYRWKAADGTVTYSQDPPDAGARDVKRVDVKTLSPEQVRAARRLLGTDTQRANAAADAREQALSDADRGVRAATSALTDAETALTSGREPLPGERLGTANGKTRLTQAYFDRLRGLENQVEGARRRLDRAYRRRNDLR
ncbi:MAG: DUF4124 domain-containing protein [Burkholderiales bacterium]|nr:DUF4124 domain-containing protein [Burkholderiales bacterium]